MLRKVVIALATTAALGLAFVPGSASARMGGGGGGGGHMGGGHMGGGHMGGMHMGGFRHDHDGRFFRHDRDDRFRHRRFFFGGPFFYGDDYYGCWRWWHGRRIWVCGY